MRYRFIFLVIALAYSFAVSGLAVRAHFCKGYLSSFDLAIATHSSCDCQEKSMDESCCHNVTGYFCVANDQHAANGCSIPNCYCSTIENFNSPPLTSVGLRSLTAGHYYSDHPQVYDSVPLYILLGNFRN